MHSFDKISWVCLNVYQWVHISSIFPCLSILPEYSHPGIPPRNFQAVHLHYQFSLHIHQWSKHGGSVWFKRSLIQIRIQIVFLDFRSYICAEFSLITFLCEIFKTYKQTNALNDHQEFLKLKDNFFPYLLVHVAFLIRIWRTLLQVHPMCPNFRKVLQ